MNPNDRLAAAELLLSARKLDEAIAAFDDAEAAGADAASCSAGLWLAHMLQGNFEAAWRQNDRIRAQNLPDPHRLWSGELLEGRRVIVRCLHGFGDTVQLFQYAPLLRQRATHVWWEVAPAMLSIASCFNAVDNVLTWGEMAPRELPTWDVQLEITELPYIFRTQLNDLPLQTNYLDLPQSFARSVAAAMEPRTLPRVGVVWEAGAWNTSRSIPVTDFAALLDHKEVEWWNLQGGPSRYELPTARATVLREIQACNDGILPLAAVIAHLDLVITVDTLAAHIAGSLEIPALLLLQHAGDWRWVHGRADTPWYPSVQLLRQPVPGYWKAVLTETLRLVGETLGLRLSSDLGNAYHRDSSEMSCSN